MPTGPRYGIRSGDPESQSGRTISSAVLNAEIDATGAHPGEVVDELQARVDAKVESVQPTVEDAKRALDPRRLLKEHPVASAAIALGAIGVGVVGYRFVRRSLLVRIYLAVRFGRLRELFPA